MVVAAHIVNTRHLAVVLLILRWYPATAKPVSYYKCKPIYKISK